MKKYQVYSNILLNADGWVIAKNKKEADKKWRDFCREETRGLSYITTKIIEIIPPNNRNYDKSSIPNDNDFNNNGCLTYNLLN